jgi:hypothetical protein
VADFADGRFTNFLGCHCGVEDDDRADVVAR